MSTKVTNGPAKTSRGASARINLRIDRQIKALLVRAANSQQIRLTEFMVKSSRAAAETALTERSRFVLPADKWREFNAALDAPAREIPALRRLFSGRSVFNSS